MIDWSTLIEKDTKKRHDSFSNESIHLFVSKHTVCNKENKYISKKMNQNKQP